MPKKPPKKLFYKIGEVCEEFDLEPHVLRYWETEFPQLAPKKSRSGQRMYGHKDLELISKIQDLLYNRKFRIAGARRALGMRRADDELTDAEVASSLKEALGELKSELAELKAQLDKPIT